MATIPAVRRNTLYSFFSSAIRLVSNLLLFVGIARFYGVETFGQFSAAHAIMSVFFLLADFGFDMLVTTGIARERGEAGEYVRRCLPVKLVFAFTSFALMAVVAAISDLSTETKVFMLILSLGIVANAVSSFCYAVFKGYEDLSQEFRVSLIQNSVLLVLLVVLGSLGAHPYVIAAAFVASRIFGVLSIAPKLLSRHGVKRLDFPGPRWADTVRQGLPFGIHLIFGTLYFQLDTVMLAYFRGDEAVGIYQSAMRLVYGIFIIPEVLSNAFIPVLSRLYGENREQWGRIGRVLQKTLLFSSLPVGVIFYLYADQLISFIYGSEMFAAAVPLLRVFAFVIVIRFTVETSALVLTVSRAQEWRMRIVVFLTVFNVVLNLFAIPRYGVTGAAAVSLITSIVAGLLYVIAAHARAFHFGYMFGIRPALAAAMVLCFVAILSVVPVGSMFVGIPLVLLACAAIFYLVGYSGEERAIVFSLPGKWSLPGQVAR